MDLSKYSIGTGDRFSCQGEAQLKAIIKAKELGLDISIVWNKSYREHDIIGTSPKDVLFEAENAVKELNWEGNYYIDADHIELENVDIFIDFCNYFTTGIHLKTAGTTWLEELIGLAQSGNEGVNIVKEIYRKAFKRYTELIIPYSKVINIDKSKLPDPNEVNNWSSEDLVNSLRHDLTCIKFNPNFRQLFHISYKIAAEMGDRFIKAIRTNKDIIAKNVTKNLFERHIKPIFL